jgi:hypothetical protein
VLGSGARPGATEAAAVKVIDPPKYDLEKVMAWPEQVSRRS